jgi:hypothetical protein
LLPPQKALELKKNKEYCIAEIPTIEDVIVEVRVL